MAFGKKKEPREVEGYMKLTPKRAICRHQCLHEMEKQIFEQRRVTTSK